MSAVAAVERPAFMGRAGDVFSLKFLKMILWFCTIVGIPIGYRYYIDWVIGNIALRNGGRLSFTGPTRGLYKYFLIFLGISVADNIWTGVLTPADDEGLPLAFLLRVVLFVLSLVNYVLNMWVGLAASSWVISHTHDQEGTEYRFTPPLAGYIGRHIVLALTFFTIIGWAWYMAAFFRWLASHLHAPHRHFEFHGKGLEILWRVVLWVLACIPIVTIPWVIAASYRWWLSQIEIHHHAVEPNVSPGAVTPP